jgi:hypothetical protein
MSPSAKCQLIGRWRITESDLWDRKYLDLVAPAYIEFGRDSRGEFAFGVVQAGMSLGYSRTIVHFRWHGSDEGDEISGSGSAELQDDGRLEIELSWDDGDDATFIAHREST